MAERKNDPRPITFGTITSEAFQPFSTQNKNEKLPLQIMIPDNKDDYVTSGDDQRNNIKRDNIDTVEYEYEDGEVEDSQSTVFL